MSLVCLWPWTWPSSKHTLVSKHMLTTVSADNRLREAHDQRLTKIALCIVCHEIFIRLYFWGIMSMYNLYFNFIWKGRLIYLKGEGHMHLQAAGCTKFLTHTLGGSDSQTRGVASRGGKSKEQPCKTRPMKTSFQSDSLTPSKKKKKKLPHGFVLREVHKKCWNIKTSCLMQRPNKIHTKSLTDKRLTIFFLFQQLTKKNNCHCIIPHSFAISLFYLDSCFLMTTMINKKSSP